MYEKELLLCECFINVSSFGYMLFVSRELNTVQLVIWEIYRYEYKYWQWSMFYSISGLCYLLCIIINSNN